MRENTARHDGPPTATHGKANDTTMSAPPPCRLQDGGVLMAYTGLATPLMEEQRLLLDIGATNGILRLDEYEASSLARLLQDYSKMRQACREETQTSRRWLIRLEL